MVFVCTHLSYGLSVYSILVFSHCRNGSIDKFAELQVQDKFEAEVANVEEKMNVGMYEISQS